MVSQEYLPLTEYSSKYRVSISTLRRRIKSEEIPYEFKEGKYFLLDQPVSTHQRSVSPSPRIIREDSLMSAPKDSFVQRESFVPRETRARESFERESLDRESPDRGALEFDEEDDSGGSVSSERNEPILSTANRLLTELKKAYTQILQEKEDLILHLREEVSDLRTLARVLEEENNRLRKGRVNSNVES